MSATGRSVLGAANGTLQGRNSEVDGSRKPCPLRVKTWASRLPSELFEVLIEPGRRRSALFVQLASRELRLSDEECYAAAEWLEHRRRRLLAEYHKAFEDYVWQIEEYRASTLACALDIQQTLNSSGLRVGSE